GRERDSVHASLMTCYPAYPAYAGLLRSLVQALTSGGGIYIPETVEISGLKGKLRFNLDEMESLSKRWDSETPISTWILSRERPMQIRVTVGKGRLPFEPFSIDIEQAYFGAPGRSAEFLSVVREFYNILHPAYSEARVFEMARSYQSPLGRVTPGMDLERGLPEIYWANFLGQEYVEMFGKERVYSAPCYSIEPLSDGGALLLLSSSPLDYLNDPEGLDTRRSDIKKHLGLEAFDTGDFHFRGKVPRFRYLEERKATIERMSPVERMARQARRDEPPSDPSDWILTVPRTDWDKWIENNRSLSETFILDMEQKGVRLGLSEQSLRNLD